MRAPNWIALRDVMAVHDRLLALHGGGAGVRDQGLLESALARPQHHWACAADPDTVTLAAAYTAGIVKNHPFVDGNKRTGFVVGIMFLELNGVRFEAGEPEATQAVLGLAAGTLSEEQYEAFLRANSQRRRKRSS
jgi:death-on-curing protein